jgi:hypothetical protein
VLKIIFISQCERSLNRQEYIYDITDVEQAGKLEYETLEELCILAVQQNSGQGNYQVIAEVKKMEKLIEKSTSICPIEEKPREFAEDKDVQIHEKVIQEPGYDDPVNQSGLVVKKGIQGQWIPHAHRAHQYTALPEA